MKRCRQTFFSFLCANFRTTLRQCIRKEDGVAFITFGIFVALLGLLLLAANIDFGRSFGSQTEIRSKLEEYSTLLTQEFSELWLKGALCSQSSGAADCTANADTTQRVFDKPLNSYFSADGSGTFDKAIASADMQNYIDKALNDDLGRLRFQGVKSTAVTIECDDNTHRQKLTFTSTAEQFNTFWKGNASNDINISVKRLSKVPCDFGSLPPTPNPPVCPAGGCVPTPGVETCFHGVKQREASITKATDTFFSSQGSTTLAGLSAANSVVNFVMSLDARSKANLGNSDNLLSRFARSLASASSTLDAPNKIAAGLTIGNFPAIGGGAPTACNTTQGAPGSANSLVNSGTCYDDVDKPTLIKRANTTPGYQNLSRKTSLSGEFRAQFTRRCTAENAVWTYEARRAGNCFERANGLQVGNHHAWQDVSGNPTRGEIAAMNNAAREAIMPDINRNADSICSDAPNNITRVAGVDSWMDRVNIQCHNGSFHSGSGDANDRNCRYSIAATCITGERNWQDVYSGHWTAACRSENLGNTAEDTYGDPSQFVNFSGQLVANLEGDALSGPTYEAIKLSASITKADDPDIMRARDARRTGALNQEDELKNLHAKNTERSFVWACDSGPLTAVGSSSRVDNDGNLSTPYGVRTGNASRAILDDNGNPLNPRCRIPAGTTDAEGRIAGTVATYDITFRRADCDPATESCDLPEGMYALSLLPGGSRLQTNYAPSADRIPNGGLRTTWVPEASPNQKWAWDHDDGGARHATVSQSDLSRGDADRECPVVSRSAPTQTVNGADGNVYNIGATPTYRTTYQEHAGICGSNGSNCPNVSRYMLQNDDPRDTTNLIPERLNIATVAVERRQIQDRNTPNTITAPEPYLCTIDKGETTTTAQRNGLVAVAGASSLGGNLSHSSCDWMNKAGFFCNDSRGSGTSASMSFVPNQVEQPFIDAQLGGVFSLTGLNFNGPVALGDAEEQFSTTIARTINYLPRKITKTGATSITSKTDSELKIIPMQVQNEQAVRYRNSDLPPDNMEITNAQRNSTDQFKNVLTELARGYTPYDIFRHHRGNQCALIRQGFRSLWSVDDANTPKSKFLVYVGALPSAADYTAATAKHLATAKQGSGRAGAYDTSKLMLTGIPTIPTTSGSTSPEQDTLTQCLGYSAYDGGDHSTTPFIITTVDENATQQEANDLLDSLQAATAKTTNEACKRPYCVLSTVDGRLQRSGGTIERQGIFTPETCAAKLWKCISPATTKF